MTTNSKPIFATTGNYQHIRTLYFKFRALCAKFGKSAGKDGIDYRTLDDKDRLFLKTEIRENPEWKASQAFRVMSILRGYQKELESFGVVVNAPEIKEPQQINLVWNGKCFVASFYNPQPDMSMDFNLKIKAKTHKSTLEGMYWEVMPEEAPALIDFCDRWTSSMDEGTRRQLHKFISNYKASYSAERVELDIPLKLELRDYQTMGIKYQITHRRSMNCDTMGLGKTVQALASAIKLQNFPFLIVCPKSLRLNWLNEINKFTYSKAIVLDKKNAPDVKYLSRAGIDFFITNYEGIASLLHKKVGTKLRPTPSLFEFKGACFDEAHKLKNRKTKVYKTCSTLAHSVTDLHLLTGSPVDKTPAEFWAYIELMRLSDKFGGEEYFMSQYKGISASSFDDSWKTKQKLKKLNDKMRMLCMVRREKEKVAKELPETSTIVLEYEPDDKQKTTLQKAIDGIKQWAIRKKSESSTGGLTGGASLTKLNQLGKLLGTLKAEFVAELVKSIVNAGEQVVVFMHHYEVIDAFASHIGEFAEISGRVPDHVLDQSVKDFQAGKIKVIGATYKRASTGFTWTAASKLICLEYAWTYKDTAQAMARVHRIGSKFPVEYYMPVVKDSVDVYRLGLIEKKKEIFTNSVDSESDWNMNSKAENALAIMEMLIQD